MGEQTIEEEITQEEFDAMEPLPKPTVEQLPVPTVEELRAKKAANDDVQIAINHTKDGKVLMSFSRPVKKINFTVELAREVAIILRHEGHKAERLLRDHPAVSPVETKKAPSRPRHKTKKSEVVLSEKEEEK